ncbi:uncharacterized protein STEHIDRAFT_158061 [Stereum hirsutum FP-91666 SS1]|uniref:uncharacterized protein n=1 Tax=Stereum hirsutum (strain FP-91666) TaxID=721885 RepID=UPI000444937E|nr:uncharacterized protein STEHIDRAFT_158061 [Stereum hirsutum FP-91666 SS1]EIM85424.1 hypothetical protein STEHIDRAFT_158061 [Stereum hirsutum FP-91666 SS1]
MSSRSSPTPLTYTFYYSFSAPTPAKLLALLIIHHVPNLPSNPLATTFVYRHVLDGSYTPFITPIASHPYASQVTIKEEDTSDEQFSQLLQYPSPEPEPSLSTNEYYYTYYDQDGFRGDRRLKCEPSRGADEYFTYLSNTIRVSEPNTTYSQTLPPDVPTPPYGVWDPDRSFWCTRITPGRALVQAVENSYPVYFDEGWKYISPPGERVPTTRDASTPLSTPPRTPSPIIPKLPNSSLARPMPTQTEVAGNLREGEETPRINQRPGDSRQIKAKPKQGGGDDDPSNDGGDNGGGNNDNSSGHFTFNSTMLNHTHRTYTGDNPAEFKENKHVAKPPLFDGSNWDEFWTSALDNIRANPKYFQSYRRRIKYVLLFFRGAVLSWKQNYISDPDNAVDLDYPYNPDTDKLELPQEKHKAGVTKADWFCFIHLLKRDYKTLDSRGQARQKVMYSKQGAQTAAEYFQNLDLWRRIAR